MGSFLCLAKFTNYILKGGESFEEAGHGEARGFR